MRFIFGLALGLVLGIAAWASADTIGYMDVAKFYTSPQLVQWGYVMGVHDALANIATDSDPKSTALSMVSCMNAAANDSEGLRHWALRRLAKYSVTNPNDNAADALRVSDPLFPCTP